MFKNENIRNSFNRFGDDLCEHILQYLSFEDKYKYECISKQWKYCIFKKHFFLKMCYNEKWMILLEKFCSTSSENCDNKLNIIFKKCSFINKINFNINKYSYNMWLKILQIIVNNCQNMVTIKLNISVLNKELLSFKENFINATIFYYISEYYFEPKFLRNHIMDIYKINLKFLSIIMGKQSVENQNLMMSLISNFTELETFEIIFNSIDSEITPNIENYIKKIGEVCIKIKHLSFSSVGLSYNTIDLYELFKSVNNFSHLKSLVFNFDFEDIVKPLPNDFTIKLLKDCKQLEIFYINTQFTDNFFTDIHIYLPILKRINFRTDQQISDNALICLANLKRLIKLGVETNENDWNSCLISEEGVCHLIESCVSLKILDFYSPIKITPKLIDKCVKKAVIHSKINFCYNFSIINYRIKSDIRDMYLPANLQIK